LTFSVLRFVSPQAYYLLDETIIAGELQETSKQKVLHATVAQDMLIKAANGQDN